jgi:hypothetical protein
MARYQFDEKDSQQTTSMSDVANGVLDFLVRLAGLALLCIGLWTGIAIIREAWILYQNPNTGAVERFAQAIDNGSHLDRVLAPKHLKDAANSDGSDAGADFNPGTVAGPMPGSADSTAAAKPSSPPAAAGNNPEDQLKLSYFVAWAILLLVMLLVGRLSIAAIKTGGELALHDVQLKRFARQLLREMNRDRAG